LDVGHGADRGRNRRSRHPTRGTYAHRRLCAGNPAGLVDGGHGCGGIIGRDGSPHGGWTPGGNGRMAGDHCAHWPGGYSRGHRLLAFHAGAQAEWCDCRKHRRGAGIEFAGMRQGVGAFTDLSAAHRHGDAERSAGLRRSLVGARILHADFRPFRGRDRASAWIVDRDGHPRRSRAHRPAFRPRDSFGAGTDHDRSARVGIAVGTRADRLVHAALGDACAGVLLHSRRAQYHVVRAGVRQHPDDDAA
jgi:hypothetical protein